MDGENPTSITSTSILDWSYTNKEQANASSWTDFYFTKRSEKLFGLTACIWLLPDCNHLLWSTFEARCCCYTTEFVATHDCKRP